jgi:hypothetical protein
VDVSRVGFIGSIIGNPYGAAFGQGFTVIMPLLCVWAKGNAEKIESRCCAVVWGYDPYVGM